MTLNKKKTHIAILDYIRALAIIRIFLYHYYIEWFGGQYFIVPEGLEANLKKMWIFEGVNVVGGIWGVMSWVLALIKNVFSWFFIYGFATVNVFLVVSGFVLTLSLLNKGGSLLKATQVVRDGKGKLYAFAETVYGWVLYNWKRLKRILVPFYISVLAGILFWYGRNLLYPQFADWPLFNLWDMGKLLIVPYIFFDFELLQKFNGDYWFIVLIVQLYLLFPVLFFILKKSGVWKFLLIVAVITFGYRYYAAYNLDSVPMGVYFPVEHSYYYYSFFLPRMFEFAFGMALGYMCFYRNSILEGFKKTRWFLFGLILALLGYALLMYRWGWVVSDAVLGVGLFFVFYGMANWLSKLHPIQKFMLKAGESTYEIYLWHHYFLNYIVIYAFVVLGVKGEEWVFWAAMPVYFVAVLLLGRLGTFLTNVTLSISKKLIKR